MSTHPAFPLPHNQQSYPGITIRDYFAAAALSGLIAADIHQSLDEVQLARAAYAVADAMCEKRAES